MNDLATKAALAALRYWAALAGAGAAVWDSADQHEAVRQAAWLVKGEQAATGDGWPRFDLSQPLLSIFSRITPKAGQPAPKTYVRRASLAMRAEALFPTDQASASASSGADPIVGLREAVADLTQRNLPAELQLEELLYAFQRHAWCLPSPLDAVSLYDFARTNAAVAAARAMHAGDLFLLGGDLSGVQSFLYTLTAAGATKQLRGRSFYLQLLTEACAQYVLTEAGLPVTNLLYSGGGRFYALLPGSVNQSNFVTELRREIGKVLLRRHGSDLYLALGGALYQTDGNSQVAWEYANRALDDDKRRHFAELDEETMRDVLFTPHQSNIAPDEIDSNGVIPNDPLSESLEKLGRELHNKPYLLVRPERFASTIKTLRAVEPAEWHRVLRDLGLFLRPIETGRPSSGFARYLMLRDQSDSEIQAMQQVIGDRAILGTRYMVNVAPGATKQDVQQYRDFGLDQDGPLKEDDIKPFSLLVKQSQGIERLGVLRMDVDDLGDLFGQRLKRVTGIAGLAYTAALSAALSRFFEGWVGSLCQQANLNSAQGSVYPIYSGGDDLFIVGSWHLLPKLAEDIRNDFVRYTTSKPVDMPGKQAATPLITISAGITLHGSKFPLYQAATEAHEALDRAKSYERTDKRTKDALCFLDQMIGWEDYADVRDTQERLCALIDQGAPKALLMVIQSLYARYTAGRNERRTRAGAAQFDYGPWVWQGAYTLTRLAERCPEEIRQNVEQLRDRITGEVERRFIERAGLAARWAQLLLRGKEG